MSSHTSNIMNRIKFIERNNTLSKMDIRLLKIVENFGVDYNRHLFRYFDDNKINVTRKHLENIIDMLIIYYDKNRLYSIEVFSHDIKVVMEELADIGYYFTEKDALYCCQFGMYLHDFKITNKRSREYKDLKFRVLENICYVPRYFCDLMKDEEIDSYSAMIDCYTLSDIKRTFNKYNVKIDRDHFLIYKRKNKSTRNIKKVKEFFRSKGVSVR